MKGIYKITNILNNKVYIGQSINIESRWKGHLNDLNKNKHHSLRLQNSYNKYGKDNFKFEIVEIVYDDELMESREQYWIDYYDSMNKLKGYNIRGAGCHGKLAEETKEKLRKINKGKHISLETRNKISISVSAEKNGMYNKKHSNESIEKIKKSLKNKRKGIKFSQSHKENLSKALSGKNNPMYGKEGYWKNKKMSLKVRKKISDSKKGKKMNEITKLALEKSRKKRIKSGQYFSNETRLKLSQINKGKNKTEEHCKNISISKKINLYKKYLANGGCPITEKNINKILEDKNINKMKVKDILIKYNINKTYYYKILNNEDINIYTNIN